MIARVFVNTHDSGEWTVIGEFHCITDESDQELRDLAQECIFEEALSSHDILYDERVFEVNAKTHCQPGYVVRFNDIERSYFWTIDNQTGD